MKQFPALALSLPLAIAGTVLTAFSYVAVQQNYRMDANDPQIQLAEDGATALSRGVMPTQIVGSGRVEIASSLAPFVTVFDTNYQPVATSGQLSGVTMIPPTGTFEYAKAHGQDRFTWQPNAGSREAAVLVYQGGDHPGYVLAARDLAEVEAREHNLTIMAGGTLGVILVLCVALLLIFK